MLINDYIADISFEKNFYWKQQKLIEKFKKVIEHCEIRTPKNCKQYNKTTKLAKDIRCV